MGCGGTDIDQVANGEKTAVEAGKLESHTNAVVKYLAKISPALT